MKKHGIILTLALIIFFLFSNVSHAIEDKTILILLDKMDFEDIEEIFHKDDFGIGFMNLKTRKPYGNESLYFSIGTGRKVGVKSENYKGLYKNKDGIIKIVGFEHMLQDLIKENNNIKVDVLGEKLKEKGVSYIGDKSSAIIAADKNGSIRSGEIEIKYNSSWLKDRTNYHLSKSNTLVLSYDIDEVEDRIKILRAYVQEFKDYNMIIFPRKVSREMKYILNKNLVPIIYKKGENKGLLTSSSTKRKGFITLEDIFTQLLFINGEKSSYAIGSKINIVENKNNLIEAKNLFKKTINLLYIASLFHGIIYFIQVYSAYYIYKNRKDKFHDINIYNTFIVVNIFVSLLMGVSALHINIVLYLFINIMVSYIITLFISEKGISAIELFSTLTYGLIIFGIFFSSKIIYNSYIGFNNLFYGARYYGFNNGIMGVLLVTSIISYFFIRELMPNKLTDSLICLLYFGLNMIALSANYGANTGGFLTSVVLFLVMVYVIFLGRNWNVANMIILILIGVLLFAINMYFDSLSMEKSHAIDFLFRIKAFGISEFIDMFKIKLKELIKLTIMPPFSIVIICQMFSLKYLLKKERLTIKREAYIILFTALIAFLLNDTGMITFIYMTHYLISMLLYKDLENPSRI